MEKKSLRQLIEDYLESYYPNFVHKGILERMAIGKWGYLGDNCARRCRELEKSGKIIKILDGKGRVQYQYNKNMGKKQNSEDLNYNEQLQNILSAIKPTWENAIKIEEIGKAIKSNNKYLKKITVEKYK